MRLFLPVNSKSPVGRAVSGQAAAAADGPAGVEGCVQLEWRAVEQRQAPSLSFVVVSERHLPAKMCFHGKNLQLHFTCFLETEMRRTTVT